MVKNNIKINIIGNIKILPQKVRTRLIESMTRTKRCKKILINLAINYGSKDEIINATRILKRKKGNVSIKNFEKNLHTHGIPNPDLLIRTGG